MPINLKGRSILTLDALSAAEIRFLLRLAADLKAAKCAGIEQQRLKGKNIALIFEKDSTRTRTGFEVAAYDQGAHVTYLGPTGSQIGHKESMKDTARHQWPKHPQRTQTQHLHSSPHSTGQPCICAVNAGP
jgi:ornithine carbamoyltransferase